MKSMKRSFPNEKEVWGKLKKLVLEEQRNGGGKSALHFLLSTGSDVNMRLKNEDEIISTSEMNTRVQGEFEEILKILLSFGNGVNNGIRSHFLFPMLPQRNCILNSLSLQYFGVTVLNECGGDCKNTEDEDEERFVTTVAILTNLNGNDVNCEPFREDAVPLHETMKLFSTCDCDVDPASFLFFNGAQVNSILFDHGEYRRDIRPLHDLLFQSD